MARIYREPSFNNQFRSSAQGGQFVPEKAFDPSKQIRDKAKQDAENIKSLQRSQQRQAAVNEGNFRASVAKGNANFTKLKGLLSFTQDGLTTIQKIEEIKKEEEGRQEGLKFLKPEYGGSIVDEKENKNLENVAEYETDLTKSNVDLVKQAKSVSENNAKVEEEIIVDNADNEAKRSSTQITTYTAAASLEKDLEAFLRSDTKIQLADGTIIVAKDATVDQLEAVIDVGLDFVTSSYFPDQLSGKALYETYIPTAKRVYGGLLNKFTKEKIAFAQEKRILEHTDLATVELDKGKPASEVITQLSEKLYTTGAYDTPAKAFEASYNHLSNYYRSNQDEDGAAALLNTFKIVKDGKGQEGTKLADDPVYSIKIMNLIAQIQNDKVNIKKATIRKYEKNMFEKLDGVNDSKERRDIVLESVRELDEAGYHEAAENLAKQIDSLQISDIQRIEDQNIYEQVVNGEITSKDVLDKQLKLGVISKAGYDKAVEELDTKNPVIPDGQVKDYTEDIIKSSKNSFAERIGAEVNEFGEIRLNSDGGYLDTSRERGRIIAAVELDLKKVALTTYKLHKDASYGTKIAKIDEALDRYYTKQVLTEGGKWHVPEYKKDNSVGKKEIKAGTKKLKSLLNSPQNLTRSFGDRNSPLKKVNFDFNADQKITLESIKTFNPLRGDTLFKKEIHESFLNTYKETGEFDETLVEAAKAVGMTPLKFLNTQNSSHNLPQYYRPQSLDQTKDNTVASASYMMNYGLSNDAANMIVGNFGKDTWNKNQYKDSFNNNGTILNEENLDLAFAKLTLNPEMFKIATNPYATDRQLLEVAYYIYKT